MTEGQIDRGTDGLINRPIDGWIEVLTDQQTDERIDRQTRQIYRQTGWQFWMEGPTGGQMDGQTYRWTDKHGRTDQNGWTDLQMDRQTNCMSDRLTDQLTNRQT